MQKKVPLTPCTSAVKAKLKLLTAKAKTPCAAHIWRSKVFTMKKAITIGKQAFSGRAPAITQVEQSPKRRSGALVRPKAFLRGIERSPPTSADARR
ncbi:hypothetical protein ABLE93_13805 [Xanthobacter sp. KR7-65]